MTKKVLERALRIAVRCVVKRCCRDNSSRKGLVCKKERCQRFLYGAYIRLAKAQKEGR